MNEPINRETDDLAAVLSRIHALSHSGEAAAAPKPLEFEDDIPVLEEVYQGNAGEEKTETFQLQALSMAAEPAVGVDLQSLLHELSPLLQVAIRRAVMQELEQASRQLSAKLETELLELLQQHFNSSEWRD